MAGYVNRYDTSGEKTIIRSRWESLNDYATYAKESSSDWIDIPEWSRNDAEFTGVSRPDVALDLATNGWDEPVAKAVDVAADAIETVERQTEFDSFVAELGVAGCDVDIDRYLAGEPENMIDYPLRPIVKAGKVITLCASMSCSGGVSAEAIMRRGQTITAFALALSRIGYSIEIWSDLTSEGFDRRTISEFRVLLKAPGDPVDESRLLYGLAHPSMLRILGFGAMHGLPPSEHRQFGVASRYGYPHDPVENLPDGTIYLPSVTSDGDVPDAAEQLEKWLRDLDLIS